MKRLFRLGAAAHGGGRVPAGRSDPAHASSHMDAPLITLDDAANTTDVYAFVRDENGRSRSSPRSASTRSRSRASARTSTTSTTTCSTRFTSRPATTWRPGVPTFTYQFRFDTRFKNTKTILQSYLGVVKNVDDAAQNLTQSYTVTKVDHRTRPARRCSAPGVVPPNNQGNATPFYNQGDNGENPAKDGVATFAGVSIATRSSRSPRSDRGYVAFAGQRDDGFYGDIQAIFDLLKLRSPGQGLAGRVQPAPDGAGDSGRRDSAAISRSSASTRPPAAAASRSSRDGLAKSQHFGDWVQVGRQGNPLFNEGLVAIEDKDLYSRTKPSSDSVALPQVRREARNWRSCSTCSCSSPISPGIETGRTDIAGIFIPDLIKVDLSTGSARLAGGGPAHPTNPDDPGFSRLSIFGGDVLMSQIQPGSAAASFPAAGRTAGASATTWSTSR